jgi:hypothetical protein
VAVLIEVEGLAVAVTVIVALSEPLGADSVNHDALSATIQVVLDIILKVPVEFAAAATDTVVVDRVRVGEAPACVTFTVWSETPVPETVTVAERVEVEGLAVTAVTVTVPLFELLAGETVSQV